MVQQKKVHKLQHCRFHMSNLEIALLFSFVQTTLCPWFCSRIGSTSGGKVTLLVVLADPHCAPCPGMDTDANVCHLDSGSFHVSVCSCNLDFESLLGPEVCSASGSGELPVPTGLCLEKDCLCMLQLPHRTAQTDRGTVGSPLQRMHDVRDITLLRIFHGPRYLFDS